MARDKINIPSSQGGLVRYSEGYRSKIEIKPAYVVILIALVIIIEVFLHLSKPLG
ncbi:hypothetical protein CL621_03470 [archaeon]|nr:hypothetical protein [archaeon]|tara:strand:- start:550 stop:714 length:165 start_codon:yes stop_codon:yes gene_type:complete